MTKLDDVRRDVRFIRKYRKVDFCELRHFVSNDNSEHIYEM